MPVFSRLIFYAVRFGARGLRDDAIASHPQPDAPRANPDSAEKFQQKERPAAPV
jgi:hypothetical protein